MIAIPTAPSCSFLGAPLLETSAQETMPMCSKHLASEHELDLSFREVKCVRQVRWRTHLFKDDVVIPFTVLSGLFLLCLESDRKLMKLSSHQASGDLHERSHFLDIWQLLLCFLSCWLILMWSHTKWLSMPHSVSMLFCSRNFSCWRAGRHALFFLVFGNYDSCSWICLFFAFCG